MSMAKASLKEIAKKKHISGILSVGGISSIGFCFELWYDHFEGESI